MRDNRLSSSAQRSRIAELVEHEQRVIAGALVMTVPDAHLPARRRVGLTLESHALPVAGAVDIAGTMSSTMPRGGLRRCTRSIHWPDRLVSAQRFGFYGKPLRLEATHLAWRSRAALRRLAAAVTDVGRIQISRVIGRVPVVGPEIRPRGRRC